MVDLSLLLPPLIPLHPDQIEPQKEAMKKGLWNQFQSSGQRSTQLGVKFHFFLKLLETKLGFWNGKMVGESFLEEVVVGWKKLRKELKKVKSMNCEFNTKEGIKKRVL